MALTDILSAVDKRELDAEATEEYIKAHIKDYRDLIAYWRVYPDRLVDYYLSLGNPYNFRFYFTMKTIEKSISSADFFNPFRQFHI